MNRAYDKNRDQETAEARGTPVDPPPPRPSANLQSSLLKRLDELGVLEDPRFTAEVLGSYLRDGLQTLADLESAIQAQDAAACELLAHRMKGASLNLGAEKLGNIAFTLETLAGDGDLSTADSLLKQLRQEFACVRSCLLQLPGMPKAA